MKTQFLGGFCCRKLTSRNVFWTGFEVAIATELFVNLLSCSSEKSCMVDVLSKDTILNNSFTFRFTYFVFMSLVLQCIAQESLVWVPWGHISRRLRYFIEKLSLGRVGASVTDDF